MAPAAGIEILDVEMGAFRALNREIDQKPHLVAGDGGRR